MYYNFNDFGIDINSLVSNQFVDPRKVGFLYSYNIEMMLNPAFRPEVCKSKYFLILERDILSTYFYLISDSKNNLRTFSHICSNYSIRKCIEPYWRNL